MSARVTAATLSRPIAGWMKRRRLRRYSRAAYVVFSSVDAYFPSRSDAIFNERIDLGLRKERVELQARLICGPIGACSTVRTPVTRTVDVRIEHPRAVPVFNDFEVRLTATSEPTPFPTSDYVAQLYAPSHIEGRTADMPIRARRALIRRSRVLHGQRPDKQD